MAFRLSQRRKGFLRITFVVEGPSDSILLNEQRPWFLSLGIGIEIITTNGKDNMVRKAIKYYNTSIISGADKVVFLPDQHGDTCALVTRGILGVDSLPHATTLVIKRELEAWILADSNCVNCALNCNYHAPGTTDNIIDPKAKLFSVVYRNRGYIPSSVEAAKLFCRHFSIEKAAVQNNSAKRLITLVSSLVSLK